MPSTAKDFLNLIVEPTVDDFIRNPGHLRFGMIAAIVLNQMVDYIAQEGLSRDGHGVMKNRVDTVRASVISTCPEFQFIHDVADSAKHAKLSTVRPNKPERTVASSDCITATEGIFGAPFGEGVFNEASEVLVTLECGATKSLLPMVTSVLEYFQKRPLSVNFSEIELRFQMT